MSSPQYASAQFGGGMFGLPTVTEYGNDAEVLAVATWVQGIPGTEADPGATEFQIIKLIRQPDTKKDESVLDDKFLESANAVHIGDRIGFRLYLPGKPENVYLIAGLLHQGKLNWRPPLVISQAALQYCLEAPDLHASKSEHIRYRARFIDTKNLQIAEDVFRVLESASHEDLKEVGVDFPRLKLRKLLASSEITGQQRITCLRLLGIYGSEDDAKLLEPHLFGKNDGTSPDRREIVIAYLLLKGERGLPVLEEKLKDEEASFVDRNLALEAICHVARKSKRIPRDRLIESLRLPLEDMAFAETAIFELTNLKDWEIQDQLFGLFLRDDASFRNTRLMITRYFMAAAADTGDSEDQDELPRRALQAQQFLKAIEQERPDLIEKANQIAKVDVLAP